MDRSTQRLTTGRSTQRLTTGRSTKSSRQAEFIYSTFDVGRSMFISFFFDLTGRSRPEAALNPEPLNPEPLNSPTLILTGMKEFNTFPVII
jgi:hypothetical protein